MTHPVLPDESSAANRRANARGAIIVREARLICGMDVFFGYGINISRGGMFIAASAPRKRVPADVFEIHFSLPGDDSPFRCRAREVWVRAYRRGAFETPGFGVQFLDLPEQDAERIETWVNERRAGGTGARRPL